MCLLYVYVIRQGPYQYPSCALTWIRTSLVQCTPRDMYLISVVFLAENQYTSTRLISTVATKL